MDTLHEGVASKKMSTKWTAASQDLRSCCPLAQRGQKEGLSASLQQAQPITIACSHADGLPCHPPVRAYYNFNGFLGPIVVKDLPSVSRQGRVIPLTCRQVNDVASDCQAKAAQQSVGLTATRPSVGSGTASVLGVARAQIEEPKPVGVDQKAQFGSAYTPSDWAFYKQAPLSFPSLAEWVRFLFTRQTVPSVATEPEVLPQDLNQLRLPCQLAPGYFYETHQRRQNEALSLLVQNDAAWGSCEHYIDFQVYQQALSGYEKALLAGEPLAPETLHNMMHCVYKNLSELSFVGPQFWLALSIDRSWELHKLCSFYALPGCNFQSLAPYVQCLVQMARRWIFNYKESLYGRPSVLAAVSNAEKTKTLYECHYLYQELRWLCLGAHYTGAFYEAIRHLLSVYVPLLEVRQGHILSCLVDQQGDEWEALIQAKMCLELMADASNRA